MIRTITLAFASCALAFGCSSSDEPPPPAPLTPTFTNVAKEVINTKNCGGPLCHSLTAGGFTLGSKTALHDALVDKPATGAKCRPNVDGGTAPILVVPGDPDGSLLYQKLTRIQTCGDSMPNSATVLSDTQIELVHDWIADGAKND